MKRYGSLLLISIFLLGILLTGCSSKSASTNLLPVSVLSADGSAGYRYAYDASTKTLTVTRVGKRREWQMNGDFSEINWVLPLLDGATKKNAQLLEIAMTEPYGPYAYWDPSYLLVHSPLIKSGSITTVQGPDSFEEIDPETFTFQVYEGRVVRINDRPVTYDGEGNIIQIDEGSSKPKVRYEYNVEGLYFYGLEDGYTISTEYGFPDSFPAQFDSQGRMTSFQVYLSPQELPKYEFSYAGGLFLPSHFTVNRTWSSNRTKRSIHNTISCSFDKAHLSQLDAKQETTETRTSDSTKTTETYHWKFTYQPI